MNEVGLCIHPKITRLHTYIFDLDSYRCACPEIIHIKAQIVAVANAPHHLPSTHLRVPVTIVEDHRVCRLRVDAQPTSSRRHDVHEQMGTGGIEHPQVQRSAHLQRLRRIHACINGSN